MVRSRQMSSGLIAIAIAAFAAMPAEAAIIRSAQPYVGVTHWQYLELHGDSTSQPQFAREVVVNILEIDTTAAGIGFTMQPGNGAAQGEVARMTTRSFVNSVGAQMGINVGFWDTSANYPNLGTNLVHLAASNGSVYSNAAGHEPIFNISQSNVPSIGTAGAAGSTTFNNGAPVYNAAGGNQRILTAGTVTAPNDSYTTTLNPHTAFGVSQDQKKVYLLTVDGRQGIYSGGMRTDEMATLMRQFGAWDAINLDGGGSTTMVMDDTNDGVQNARVINSPSDNSTPLGPGPERVVANSLAVFATPLAGYTPLPPVPYPGLTGVLPTFSAPVVLDSFDANTGHFNQGVKYTTSTNIAANSTVTRDSSVKAHGTASLRLDIVKQSPAVAGGTQLRFLSGTGSPANNLNGNEAMGNFGYVGFMLRVEEGSDPLYVSILIDDGTTAQNGLERGAFRQIIADGEWHLYQWNLGDAAQWLRYSGGNDRIDGPNAFIDSIFFSSANGTSGGVPWGGKIWIDTVAYNPTGTLDYLVPEPATALATMMFVGTLGARRRSRSA